MSRHLSIYPSLVTRDAYNSTLHVDRRRVQLDITKFLSDFPDYTATSLSRESGLSPDYVGRVLRSESMELSSDRVQKLRVVMRRVRESSNA